MNKEVINKIARMCLDLGSDEEFFFKVSEKGNKETLYSVGVKMIEEFNSQLILVGNCGGGFNRVFLANDNMMDRDKYMVETITSELSDEFSGYGFAGLEASSILNNDILKSKPMLLKTINCDGNIETREYNSIYDFLREVDSEDDNVSINAPLLDDEIYCIIINDITIALSDYKSLNDFYNDIS